VPSHSEVKKEANGRFVFKLEAARGEIILAGETNRRLTLGDRPLLYPQRAE
jgi:hypothetical protein